MHDGLNFLSKMTPRRAWNAGKVFSSYHVSKITGKPVQWGLPISISFEPTTSCNLRCPECPSGLRSFTRETGMLNEEFFMKTIDDIYKDICYLIFYFQGEPYLNPNFLEMVRYAANKGIYTATSTNAHYLNDENSKKTIESGLDRLIISIDGTTQDTYEQYRVGGNLEKVMEGAKNIIKWKKKLHSKKPYTIFQFLVVKPNEHQIDDLKRLAKEIGVDDIGLKTAQIYDYKNGNELIPTIDKYRRYKAMPDGTFVIKNKLLNHCWKLWHSCVITWDGMVVPCCFDKDATHRMGDLKHETFKQLWHNENYQHFRASLMKARSEIDICTNCTEGTMVWGE